MKELQSKQTHERVEFRLFTMECCWHLLCWVNPRFPSYCPNCGKYVFPKVKSWVTTKDVNAILSLKPEEIKNLSSVS